MRTDKELKKLLLVISILLSISTALFIYSERLHSFDTVRLMAQCKNDNPTTQALCLQDLLEELVRSGGVDKAFDLVAQLGEIDENNIVNCHDYAHIIGKEAYRVFAGGRPFEVSTKTAYCAYGFYHGFMETLVSMSGDVSKAKEFCDYIEEELAKKGYGTPLSCYHGIGHGWTDVHDKALWGNERAMVSPALELCEQVTQDPHKLSICATGVFDFISIGYYNDAYGLKINKKDPFWLCKEQKERYKAPCYMDLSPAVLWLGDYKLEKSFTYLSTVEKGYERSFIKGIAAGAVRFIFNRGENVEDSIDLCRTLSGENSLACIWGLVDGITQFGALNKEYTKAISFCDSRKLTPDEREVCSKAIASYSKMRYSKSKSDEICKIIENKLEYTCPPE